MIFKKLETIKDFENLKKGYLILVQWKYHARDGKNKPLPRTAAYKIYQVKKSCNEIICQCKDNIYFNYEMLIKGESIASEVYLVRSVERKKKEDGGGDT